MRKIVKGDEVVVIAGKDKGRRGTVNKVLVEKSKVLVDGINMVKKHIKANPQAGIDGGIIEKEAPIDISNIAIFNPATGKADRVGVRTLEDGNKVRIFKSNNEVIDL